MKISKKVGRMALECYYGKGWPEELADTVYLLGKDVLESFDNAHFDTLMCLIASIAGVKPEDLK